jgi:hypothetical protein
MGISVSKPKLSCALVLCIALAACGGGDDSSSDTASAPKDQSGGTIGGGSSGGDTAGGDTAGGGATPAPANSKPTIAGTPPGAAVTNQQYVFEPKAQDADGDVLTFRVDNAPPWASFDLATGKLQGTPKSSDVGTYANVKITVTDGADDAELSAFSITVQDVAPGSVELSWEAPTQNEDGSPLTDLAGYKVYWGTTPGEYPNSITIDNPSVMTYLVDNLAPNTYYFVATAFNTEGAESAPSDMASATL